MPRCRDCKYFSEGCCTLSLLYGEAIPVDADEEACEDFEPAPPEGFIECLNCGEIVPEDAEKCPHCGAIKISEGEWLTLPDLPRDVIEEHIKKLERIIKMFEQ